MRAGLMFLSFVVGFAFDAASAGTPFTETVRCPVGGQSFEFVGTGSYSTYGARPDGKPYGSWHFPLPVPVCPGNGLVVYKTFSEAEVAKLTPLVASADFVRLRSELPYYRAAWLMRALGEQPNDLVWMLNQASWEADDRPELKKRYQREFVAAAERLPVADTATNLTNLGLRLRAANAQRELGDFDAAATALEALPLASLDVPAASRAGGSEDDADKERRGWLRYARALGTVIARRDASAEPIDMIGRQGVFRCIELKKVAMAEPLCATPEMKADVERIEKDQRAGE